jgi:diaminohydroxyphosphoribosylaminopyrimidine deaminase/5-amino-6-(5-phosphoribosylamino)uracil reductase
VGVTDPDPRVAGKGIEELRKAGIQVDCGIAEKEVRKSLAPYLHQRTHNSVYTVLKIACTLDGCMSAADGSSQWITGEDARNDAMRLRAESQAIVTGVGTVLADNPRMNVRAPIVSSQTPLLRVVLDTKGKTPSDAHIFNPDFGPSLLLTSSLCPEAIIKDFEKRGIETEILPLEEGKISLAEALRFISKRGIIQTLVEGGPTLTSAFLKQQLFQQLTAYIGPKIMGGKGQIFSKHLDWQAIDEALPLELTAQTNLNGTIRLDYRHQNHRPGR